MINKGLHREREKEIIRKERIFWNTTKSQACGINKAACSTLSCQVLCSVSHTNAVCRDQSEHGFSFHTLIRTTALSKKLAVLRLPLQGQGVGCGALAQRLFLISFSLFLPFFLVRDSPTSPHPTPVRPSPVQSSPAPPPV